MEMLQTTSPAVANMMDGNVRKKNVIGSVDSVMLQIIPTCMVMSVLELDQQAS
jgi:hypothetical protein